jgi:phage shock protein B
LQNTATYGVSRHEIFCSGRKSPVLTHGTTDANVNASARNTARKAGTGGMNWDLVVIFAFVITLVSIRSRYRYMENTAGSLSTGDQLSLTRAAETVQKLEQRVETLERLLDEDAPGWRARARA